MPDDAPERPTMAAPFFIGAPWVPKFRGSNVLYEDWESQIGAMLRAQTWSDEQQCDFVLSALEGEPRREILILEKADRDTPGKICDQLKGLYGDKMSAGALRSMFYDCRQRPEKSMLAYTPI